MIKQLGICLCIYIHIYVCICQASICCKRCGLFLWKKKHKHYSTLYNWTALDFSVNKIKWFSRQLKATTYLTLSCFHFLLWGFASQTKSANTLCLLGWFGLVNTNVLFKLCVYVYHLIESWWRGFVTLWHSCNCNVIMRKPGQKLSLTRNVPYAYVGLGFADPYHKSHNASDKYPSMHH